MTDEKYEKNHHTGKSLTMSTWGNNKDLSAVPEYLEDELVVWFLKVMQFLKEGLLMKINTKLQNAKLVIQVNI